MLPVVLPCVHDDPKPLVATIARAFLMLFHSHAPALQGSVEAACAAQDVLAGMMSIKYLSDLLTSTVRNKQQNNQTCTARPALHL